MALNTDQNKPIENKDHDIYNDPKIAESKTTDPIYDLIKENWKHFTLTIVAVLVGIYFVQTFKESYQSSMQASADLFRHLQMSYKAYKNIQDELKVATAELAATEQKGVEKKTDTELNKKIEELSKKTAESKSQVEQLINSTSDSREPYKSLAKLYQADLLKIENPTISKDILKPFLAWKEIGSDGSPERLKAELAALLLARIELANQHSADAGKNIILDLIKNAEFTSVSAAKILAGISKTEAEREEARTIIKNLSTRQPEQTALLTDILNNL